MNRQIAAAARAGVTFLFFGALFTALRVAIVGETSIIAGWAFVTVLAALCAAGVAYDEHR